VGEITAIAAYRVVQEALTNATRHARASHVSVAVYVEDSTLHAEVADNGGGFDPRDLAANQSLGIAGMRERAGLAGGSLEIFSQVGSGARVHLTLPLDPSEGGRI
jgi:signal transduction histidine kinase